MPSQISSTSSRLSIWRSWCAQLWSDAESRWITRTGQDHFNRDKVIIPALTAAIAAGDRFCSLVDIGCGDGYVTAALLDSLDSVEKRPGEVLLLDLSERQLARAVLRPALTEARVATIDLETSVWSTQLSLPCHPTAFVSVFVLQELPSLEPLLSTLENVLEGDDLALCVTLAPSFSQRLADRGKVRFETSSTAPQLDWEWAGGFPVPVGNETLYLPHFQRSLQSIVEAHDKHHLTVTSIQELSISESVDARRIFSDTAYGTDIIGRPSSVLLSIRKAPTSKSI